MATKWKNFSKSIPVRLALWAVLLGAAAFGLFLFGSAQRYAAQTEDDYWTAEYPQTLTGAFSEALKQAGDGDPAERLGDVLYYVELADGTVYANYVEVPGGNGETAVYHGSALAALQPPYSDWSDSDILPSGCLYRWGGGAGEFMAVDSPADDETHRAVRAQFDALAQDSGLEVQRVLLAVPYHTVNQQHNAYRSAQQDVIFNTMWLRFAVPGFAALILTAAAGLWLLVIAGRSAEDDALRLFWIDQWPTELHLLGSAGLAGLAGWLLMQLSWFPADQPRLNTAPLLVGAYLAGLLLFALLLSLSRKIKGRRLLRCSFIGWIFCRIGRLFSGEFWLIRYPFGRRGAYRILWVGAGCVAGTLLSAFLTAFLFGGYYYNFTALVILLGFVWTCGGALYLFAQQRQDARQLDALLAQIEHASRGEAAQVFLPQQSPLYPYARDVAALDQKVAESVSARMRSERMKLDLITNVSHDLKTPLTSIIGYVDLLQKQELPAEAADYVQILRRKSERLNDTVCNLFTLAKSTSGAEPLMLEPLDLVMAVNQTVADMADRIEQSGIPVKCTLPDEAWVLGESAKLYRVLQNLLDNALRYSLAGTRIFLRVERTAHATVRLTLVNTASYPMDFTAEEIMQRFARGDRARTTEGSGLGLSIAESFLQNFGGDLTVTIDGDTFRVACTFQAAAKKEPSQQEPEAPLTAISL